MEVLIHLLHTRLGSDVIKTVSGLGYVLMRETPPGNDSERVHWKGRFAPYGAQFVCYR